MMNVDVSVIIVSWNTRDLLDRCLASYYENQGSLSSEVIVVDNASADSSAEMVQRRYPQATLLQQAVNTGFARANNRALTEAVGRYVVLLNSDTVVLGDAIGAMVRFADAHADVGIVGPRLVNADGTLQPSWARFPTLFDEWVGKPARLRTRLPTSDGATAFEVGWVSGACLLIRRAALEQIGLLDERLFMYSEDVDWCHRAQKGGWRVCYYPAAQVVHLGGRSSQRAATRASCDLWWSKVLLAAKYRGPICGAILYALLFLRHVAAAGSGLMLQAVPGVRSDHGALLFARYREVSGEWIRRRHGLWQALSRMASDSPWQAAQPCEFDDSRMHTGAPSVHTRLQVHPAESVPEPSGGYKAREGPHP